MHAANAIFALKLAPRPLDFATVLADFTFLDILRALLIGQNLYRFSTPMYWSKFWGPLQDEARSLLCDPGWLTSKRLALGIEAVLSDFDLIARFAAEQCDWAWALGGAVAGALTIQGAFQIPPNELIPIYARAGRGEHAVEMAQYVESEYSRAYVLLEIADAVEASNPALARRIRNKLWHSYVPKTNAAGLPIDGDICWNSIVVYLTYAEPTILSTIMPGFNADLRSKIIDCLLKKESTLHRLIDLPPSELEYICAQIVSTKRILHEHEQLFIAGFDPDVNRAQPHAELPEARLVLDARMAGERNAPERAQAIHNAMAHIDLYPSFHVQLIVRALLKLNPADTITAARQRSDLKERIQLMIETSMGLVRSESYDDALDVFQEALDCDLTLPVSERTLLGRARGSEVEWIAEGIIRGIAKLDPERALSILSESDLEEFTDTDLHLVALGKCPSYEEVKRMAEQFKLPEWRHATALRAQYDLAGAYQTWKAEQTRHQRDTNELQAMLRNARTEEGDLIMRLLREELFPRLWPARQASDITSLSVQVACSTASVNKEEAKSLLEEVGMSDAYKCGYNQRRDRISLLPIMALAGDANRALRLARQLDKDDVGFSAMAIGEIARLSHVGVIDCKDHHLSSALEWVLRETKDRDPLQGIEDFLSSPWLEENARVVVSLGRRLTPRPLEWGLKHTFAVLAGKANSYWQTIQQYVLERLDSPEDRDIVWCEASQWMPLDQVELLEEVQNPALAAIAWGRMARRATSSAERISLETLAEQFADLWADPFDELASMDILWVFVQEMGGRNRLSRRTASRVLEQCAARNLYGAAPALLKATIPGLFNTEQLDNVSKLAMGWQECMHTYKFATSPIPADDANRIAAENLVRIAGAWWKTNAFNARECINMALNHMKNIENDARRWNVQKSILRCWADHGDEQDWKCAVDSWRWGPAFLDAAGSFVERWSALGNLAYVESQSKAVHWAQSVSENVLNAI